MKVLTTNFVTCAVRSCSKSSASYPLKFTECELARQETDFDPQFIINVLPKIEWSALVAVAADLGNTSIPHQKPEVDPESTDEATIQLLKDLHELLIETQILNGAMTCGSCGHTYFIKNSIANFLLPPHLSNSGVPE